MDLFKENIQQLQDKNDDLSAKMTSQPNQAELQQMNQLFVGLKEDNERLAEEIGNL